MEIKLGNSTIQTLEIKSKFGWLSIILSDQVVSPGCIPPNYWEESLLQATFPYWKDAELILDIGAHIGSHSLYFSTYNPKAYIHAFEPVYFELTEYAFLQNGINGEVHRYGLSDKEQFISIADPRTHSDYRTDGPSTNFGHTSVNIRNENGDNPIELFLRTLDSIFPACSGPSSKVFIKLDVEGLEPQVLRGATNFINKIRPVIWLESWPKETMALDILKEWNYTVKKLDKMDYLALPKEMVTK